MSKTKRVQSKFVLSSWHLPNHSTKFPIFGNPQKLVVCLPKPVFGLPPDRELRAYFLQIHFDIALSMWVLLKCARLVSVWIWGWLSVILKLSWFLVFSANVGMLKEDMTLLLQKVLRSNCTSGEWLLTECKTFTVAEMKHPMGHIRL
jgi:hypothetical protein